MDRIYQDNLDLLNFLEERNEPGVSRGWGSIIVWGTVDLEQSEQRKKDRR